MQSVTTIIVFVLMGLIGGIAHVIIDSESWEDLKKFSSFKTMVIGGIAGFVYSFLYSDYSFPNGAMAFVTGYMGTDFIKSLIDRLGKKKNNG